MQAWLGQVARLLGMATEAAIREQPLVVFVLLLCSGTLIVLVGMALRYKYKTEKLRSMERRQLVAVLSQINFADRDRSLTRLLSWLPGRRH